MAATAHLADEDLVLPPLLDRAGGIPPKFTRDQVRKKPPKPDTWMGRAYACYQKYVDKYKAISASFDAEFTQLAREEAIRKERARLAALKPPSPIVSPRIEASVEDIIDAAKSRVRKGKVKRVRKLFKDNPQIHVDDHSDIYGGWTVLIAAARMGALHTCQLLVRDLGCDVNQTDKHGWTALMFAAHRGHRAVVEYLCEIGRADRLLKCKGRGWIALQYARQRGHEDTVMYLSGDTPAQTPRLMPYEGMISLRSEMYPNWRKERIKEAVRDSRVNCWCENLEERCRKCKIRENQKLASKADEERAAFLQYQRDQAKRRRRMFRGPNAELSSDSEEEVEEDEDEDPWGFGAGGKSKSSGHWGHGDLGLDLTKTLAGSKAGILGVQEGQENDDTAAAVLAFRQKVWGVGGSGPAPSEAGRAARKKKKKATRL